MQLGEPGVERRTRLEGSHDGYGGDNTGRTCRERSFMRTYNRTALRYTQTKTEKHSLPGGGGWPSRKPWAPRDWLNICGKGGASSLGVETSCRALRQGWQDDGESKGERWEFVRKKKEIASVTCQCRDSQRSWRIEGSDVGSQDVLSAVETVQRSGRFSSCSQRAGEKRIKGGGEQVVYSKMLTKLSFTTLAEI